MPVVQGRGGVRVGSQLWGSLGWVARPAQAGSAGDTEVAEHDFSCSAAPAPVVRRRGHVVAESGPCGWPPLRKEGDGGRLGGGTGLGGRCGRHRGRRARFLVLCGPYAGRTASWACLRGVEDTVEEVGEEGGRRRSAGMGRGWAGGAGDTEVTEHDCSCSAAPMPVVRGRGGVFVGSEVAGEVAGEVRWRVRAWRRAGKGESWLGAQWRARATTLGPMGPDTCHVASTFGRLVSRHRHPPYHHHHHHPSFRLWPLYRHWDMARGIRLAEPTRTSPMLQCLPVRAAGLGTPTPSPFQPTAAALLPPPPPPSCPRHHANTPTTPYDRCPPPPSFRNGGQPQGAAEHEKSCSATAVSPAHSSIACHATDTKFVTDAIVPMGSLTMLYYESCDLVGFDIDCNLVPCILGSWSDLSSRLKNLLSNPSTDDLPKPCLLGRTRDPPNPIYIECELRGDCMVVVRAPVTKSAPLGLACQPVLDMLRSDGDTIHDDPSRFIGAKTDHIHDLDPLPHKQELLVTCLIISSLILAPFHTKLSNTMIEHLGGILNVVQPSNIANITSVCRNVWHEGVSDWGTGSQILLDAWVNPRVELERLRWLSGNKGASATTGVFVLSLPVCKAQNPERNDLNPSSIVGCTVPSKVEFRKARLTTWFL
ncbi:hypothetical protein C8Q74DRAFT_1221980 [Fomes fomentarius]|nr:hypothetical protein C8Q74DRAFT_1221980 [Fomes fomentarius]